jgi:hypothetical protein
MEYLHKALFAIVSSFRFFFAPSREHVFKSPSLLVVIK